MRRPPDRAGRRVQRLANGEGPDRSPLNGRHRLGHDLETRLADRAASGPTSIVLLLVKLEQLALLEQSRAHGASLADTIIDRLGRLPHARASYRLESDIVALVLSDDADRPSGLRASGCVRRARMALRAPVGAAGQDYALTMIIGAAACPVRTGDKGYRCAKRRVTLGRSGAVRKSTSAMR